MITISVRNVHCALPEGLYQLDVFGQRSPSRYGDVIVNPMPVTTFYSQPTERVLFWPRRDANPFFHFFESLWMLAGRRDVGFVSHYAKRMAEFSDDGRRFHGAYGWRWRHHFEHDHLVSFDQLSEVVDLLRSAPLSRRAVITMWDPAVDLRRAEYGRDLPCNTHIYVWQEEIGGRKRFNMTVCCRSNDIIWGAYGANAVHFSVLQEYLAAMVGAEVGRLWQVSNNYHAYTSVFEPLKPLIEEAAKGNAWMCPYEAGVVKPYPLVEDATTWMRDLGKFLAFPQSSDFSNSFFSVVAKPLWAAYEGYKKKEFNAAHVALEGCEATDWKKAAVEWLERREAKYNGAEHA